MRENTKESLMVRKAIMLADITGCKLEEALIYLVVRKAGCDIDIKVESRMTGLPEELIQRLDGANLYYVLL